MSSEKKIPFVFKLERVRLFMHTRCQIGRLEIGKWVNKCRFLDISHQFRKTMNMEHFFAIDWIPHVRKIVAFDF